MEELTPYIIAVEARLPYRGILLDLCLFPITSVFFQMTSYRGTTRSILGL